MATALCIVHGHGNYISALFMFCSVGLGCSLGLLARGLVPFHELYIMEFKTWRTITHCHVVVLSSAFVFLIAIYAHVVAIIFSAKLAVQVNGRSCCLHGRDGTSLEI